MDIISTLFVGVALSMDAFAVSISKGMSVGKNKFANALKIGIFFGLFQALMPLIGYFAGSRFSNYIAQYSDWLAFILLSILGIKMLYDCISDPNLQCSTGIEIIGTRTLLLLSIATSIDALLVGLSYAFVSSGSIVVSSSIIGITTFTISFIGVLLGKKFCSIFQKKSEILGGVILILMGVKIILSHFNVI